MNTSVPPITTPIITPSPADKVIDGIMENIPVQVEIKTGDNIMLQVLMNTASGENGLFKMNAFVNGEQIKQPLDVKISQNVNFPPESVVNVKVTGKDASGLQIRLLSVNGEKPENFLLKAETGKTPPQTNSVIKDLGNIKQNLGFSNGSLEKIAADIVKELQLPAEKGAEIVRQMGSVKTVLSLNEFFPDIQNQVSGKNEFPQPLLSELKNILQNYQTETNKSETIPTREIKAVFEKYPQLQIEGELKFIGENKLPVVKTPLGDVYPDKNIRLPEGTKFLFAVKELLVPERGLSPEVVSGNVLATGMDGKGIGGASHNILASILEVLKPLEQSPQKELFQQIVAKIPAPNAKMLANLVSYVKAAGSNDVTAWLGKELTEQLNNGGIEARETLAKLGELFTAPKTDTVQWRIIDVPFYAGENMSKIRIAVKKMQQDEEQNKNSSKQKTATRFVLDTSFSRLGSFQFDGFSIKDEKRFDLIIRTEKYFEEDFCSNVIRIFKKTLNDVGYVGNVYVNLKENFIKVCEDNINNELKDGIFI